MERRRKSCCFIFICRFMMFLMYVRMYVYIGRFMMFLMYVRMYVYIGKENRWWCSCVLFSFSCSSAFSCKKVCTYVEVS